jgi:hypothetical protein
MFLIGPRHPERSVRGAFIISSSFNQRDDLRVFCSVLALVALSLRFDCFRQNMRSFSDKPKLQLRRLPQRQLRFTARQNMQTMYAVGPRL